jgi:hypothetical protein
MPVDFQQLWADPQARGALAGAAVGAGGLGLLGYLTADERERKRRALLAALLGAGAGGAAGYFLGPTALGGARPPAPAGTHALGRAGTQALADRAGGAVDAAGQLAGDAAAAFGGSLPVPSGSSTPGLRDSLAAAGGEEPRAFGGGDGMAPRFPAEPRGIGLGLGLAPRTGRELADNAGRVGGVAAAGATLGWAAPYLRAGGRTTAQTLANTLRTGSAQANFRIAHGTNPLWSNSLFAQNLAAARAPAAGRLAGLRNLVGARGGATAGGVVGLLSGLSQNAQNRGAEHTAYQQALQGQRTRP